MMRVKKTHTDMNQVKDNGFTLLEVLVAIVILSIGLLGMASLTVGIINGNKFSNNMTTATTLAQDKMEDIRRTAFATVADEPRAALPSPYAAYKREVTAIIDSPAPGMKTVSVKVFWGGASMEDHNVELKTILAQ